MQQGHRSRGCGSTRRLLTRVRSTPIEGRDRLGIDLGRRPDRDPRRWVPPPNQKTNDDGMMPVVRALRWRRPWVAWARRRTPQLEPEVATLQAEPETARRRTETVKEAKKRPCVQFGKAECEALELARAYQGQVEELTRNLAVARAIATGR